MNRLLKLSLPVLVVVLTACGDVGGCVTYGDPAPTPMTVALRGVHIDSPTCPQDVAGPTKDIVFTGTLIGNPDWITRRYTPDQWWSLATATVENVHDQQVWTGNSYQSWFEPNDLSGELEAQPLVLYTAATDGGAQGADFGYLYIHRHYPSNTDFALGHAELTWNRTAKPSISGPQAAVAYSWNYYSTTADNVQDPHYYKWYINGNDAYWSGSDFWFSAGPGMWQLRVDVWDEDGEVGSDYRYVNIADDGSGGCAPPVQEPNGTARRRFWLSDRHPANPDSTAIRRVC
ncbi:MAG: hypothetical protein HY700_17165 [Gemmatimonadetes bacterium]|nr:hypothetical protein [Gemmatimonadota bacterium]